MDSSIENTVVIKSLKDMNELISNNSSRKRMHDSNFKSHVSLEDTFSQSKDRIVGFDVLKRLREKDKEIIDAKSTISLLEGKVATIQSRNKETLIKYEAELESIRTIGLKNKDKISDLSHRVTLATQREKDAKNQLSKVTETLVNEKTKLKSQINELISSHAVEKNAYVEQIDDLRRNVDTYRKSAQQKELRILELSGQLEELKETMQNMQNKQQNCSDSLSKIEELNHMISSKDTEKMDLMYRLDSLKDHESKLSLYDDTMKKLFTAEADVFRLQQENYDFRKASINSSLIEEQMSSLQKQLTSCETRCKSVSEENGSLLSLKEQFKQYENVIKDELHLDSLPSVSKFRELLQSLCHKDEELQKTIDTLKSSVKSHETSRIQQEEFTCKMRGELENCKDQLEKKLHLIRRLQRKIGLVVKERDSLKGIISSYESECTLNPVAIEKDKLDQMETQLDAYKNEISKLETELDQFSSGSQFTVHKKDGLNVVGSLEKKIMELEDTVEALTGEKEKLECQIAVQIPHGSYDPFDTKVMEFTENPLAQKHAERTQERKLIEEENQALKCRVQLLEQGENMDLTQKVKVKVKTINEKYVQELESKIQEHDLSIEKMQKAFGRNLKMIREAVYKLTGYRFDCNNDTWKLFHVYLQGTDHHLLLQKGSDGEFQLLETEFSASIAPLITEYLEQDNSYPAFLASITMDLFHKNLHSDGDEEDDDGDDDEEEEEDQEPPTKKPRVNDEDDLICLD